MLAGTIAGTRRLFRIAEKQPVLWFHATEMDPLVCSCGARMRIVSFITDPRVVDRILRHRESDRCKAQDPFEPRAPPRAAASSRQ